jgi:C4-dicarboxylate transporter DctM subunit
MLCILICAVVLRYCGQRIAWAWYAAVAILSLLMGPDLEAKALFLVLGYYPILKPFFDKLRPSLVWKLAYFNIVIVATYSALFYTMGIVEVLAEFKEFGVIGFGFLLIIINIFLLVVGCLVDNIPATIILAPILLPVVTQLGMSPVTFGIMLTMNLAIGFCTPPYGIDLFVASAISGVSIGKMMKYMVWFIFSLIVVLAMVTYWPAFTMFTMN